MRINIFYILIAFSILVIAESAYLVLSVSSQENTSSANSAPASSAQPPAVPAVVMGTSDVNATGGALPLVAQTIKPPASLSLPGTKSSSPAKDTQPPGIPSGVMVAFVSDTQINIVWGKSSDNVGVRGYRIYRNGTFVGSTSSTKYASIKLVPDTQYIFTVVAYDTAGNRSPESRRATVTTFPASLAGTLASSLLVPDTIPPSAPTGLIATVISATRVDISWDPATDNVGVVSYTVYESGAQVASVIGTGYSRTGLSASTYYNYSVVATDAAGNNSEPSAFRSATTNADIVVPDPALSPAPSPTTPSPTPTPTPTPTPPPPGTPADTTPPSVPTGLTATPNSATQINLSWSASTDNVGVTGYKVYRDGVFLTNRTSTTYSSRSLTPSTSYTYTVAAYDAAGNTSAQSASASATTQAAAANTVYVSNQGNPITPSSLTISAGTTVTFRYISSSGEAKMQFTPSPPSNFTLDKDINSRTYTFTTAGTWTYNGGGAMATIIVQ